MKAFLICPDLKAVIPIDIDPFDPLSDICKRMGCKWIEQTMFTVGNDLLMDEYGKMKYPNEQGYFLLPGFHQVIAGYAVVIGTRQHEWCDSNLMLEQVKHELVWCRPTKEVVRQSATFLWG